LVRTFMIGKVAFMPKQYSVEIRAKAVRLVQDHRGDYASEYEAITTVAGRLGMNPETLRKWIRQAEVDTGQADGATTAAAREIRELKRCNAELEQTVAITQGRDIFLRAGERPATAVICAFIAEHRARFGVVPICRVLTQQTPAVNPVTVGRCWAVGFGARRDVRRPRRSQAHRL
jgi:transposase